MGLRHCAPRAGLFLRRLLLKRHVSHRISAAQPWTPVNRRVSPPTELSPKTSMDLADLIHRNAAFAPDKPAIRFAGSALTYAGLAQRIGQAARALKSQLGVGAGDRVAILAANHPDYLVLLYACARLGALLVPLNWRSAVPEQVYILCDASVKALIVEQVGARRRAARGGTATCASSASTTRWPTGPAGGAARGGQRRRTQPQRRHLLPAADRLHVGTTGYRRAPCCARRRWRGTRS